MRIMVLHQPVGPVAAFCAWNFPALNVVRKLAPAIAAGCSTILKPSEETPGSAVEVMRCFADAGVPGEVAQLVFGVPDTISRRLIASPVTRKLSFTGTVPVGKKLIRVAADTRSEERRVGKEGVSTWKSRGSAYHQKKNIR